MADDDQEAEHGNYRTQQDIRRERFLALGGDKTIYMRLRDYRSRPVLGDLVTDEHRDLVLDLRAGGLSQDAIAVTLGMSKASCQKLFAYELETGLNIAVAAVSTALLHNGMGGETAAALGFLKNHPELAWNSKSQVTGKDGKDLIPENASQVEANQILLAGMLTALSTDKTKFKRPAKDKLKPVKVVESDKPKPVKAGTTRKKAKGD